MPHWCSKSGMPTFVPEEHSWSLYLTIYVWYYYMKRIVGNLATHSYRYIFNSASIECFYANPPHSYFSYKLWCDDIWRALSLWSVLRGMAGGERHVIRMVQLPAWRERLRQAGSVTVTHLLLGTTAVHVSIDDRKIYHMYKIVIQ